MLLSQIISKDLNLIQKGGNRWEALCPWHEDTKPSLQIHDGKDMFKCFVCGRGGRGAVRYIMESRNLSYRESLQLLKTEYDTIDFEQFIEPEEAVYCLPAQRFKKPSFHHFIYGDPTNIYEYRNLEGRLLGYTCRYNTPDKGKIVLPYNYIMVNDSPEWVFKGFKTPSLPYKAELLTIYPNAVVCIVEGEKVADWALKHSKRDVIFLAWVGGANAIKYIDWTCLKGRHIILIPDHDKEAKDDKGNLKPIRLRPGNKAMLEIAETIKDIASKVEFIKIPEELPHKWDLADREWKPGDLKYWISKYKQTYKKLKL